MSVQFDPADDFAMNWEVSEKSRKRLADIVKAAKNADRLILATDPDREGEAISWHVLELLKERKALKDKPVLRVVFNAVTRDAVLEAMENPRAIDNALVEAYLARRARLSGRLYPVAGPVAQAARCTFGRPRPIGCPSAGIGARA